MCCSKTGQESCFVPHTWGRAAVTCSAWISVRRARDCSVFWEPLQALFVVCFMTGYRCVAQLGWNFFCIPACPQTQSYFFYHLSAAIPACFTPSDFFCDLSLLSFIYSLWNILISWASFQGQYVFPSVMGKPPGCVCLVQSFFLLCTGLTLPHGDEAQLEGC